MVVCQCIAVAQAWLENPLVVALNHLASGVSSEIPARTLAVAHESWGFRVAVPFFQPVAIVALREASREMQSQRLPVLTSQVRSLFLWVFGTGVPEQCGARGNAAA